ncbi:NAD-dependent epimerase/dehydratase family protein [Microtetraspora niveoalba]|uniref:NAD-dependent epimerase/dehydratase family protein n=1 Tax=Microtetraspora niveoalba TaxID=46175 RepID=UPI0008339878|nr:NAD(P)-dependent oxidoreductase [Microtetraspora niveoalba]
MRVLLAGATGTIGSALVPLLLAAGHEVLGLTRSDRGAGRLAAAGAEPVRVGIMDAGELLAALDGREADAVIHQATSITGMPMFHRSLYATDALRDQGTANLLRAAALVGARHFVTQSFYLGYGYRDHGTEPVTEDRPFATLTGHRGMDVHMRSLRANEEQVLGTPGVDGVALRYGMFYGPEPMTRQLADKTRRGLLPVPRPSGVTSPIHIHDAATAAVAALERGRPGQAYNICDDEPVEFADYLSVLAASVGAAPPRAVPAWVLSAVPYMKAFMVDSRIRLSNAKAKRELGWQPVYPSIHEGFGTL